MGFSRQEYGRGLQFSSPGDLPDPGIEPEVSSVSSTSWADSLPLSCMPGIVLEQIPQGAKE